jgi:hypothetical protein
VKIKPIKSQEELDAVVKLANNDGHLLAAPTHLVLDSENNIIGSLSFIPTVLVWMDTKKNHVRDSIKVKELYENHLAMNGCNVVCVPCTKESPYFQLMTKDGYVKLCDTTLFVKGLN